METKDRATKPSLKAGKLGWRNDLMATEILSTMNRDNANSKTMRKGGVTRPFISRKRRTAE